MRVEINHQTKKNLEIIAHYFSKLLVSNMYHHRARHFLNHVYRSSTWSVKLWKVCTYILYTIQIFTWNHFLGSRSAKLTNWPHLEALNFDCYEFFHFMKDGIYHIRKIQSPVYSKNVIFRTFRSSKTDFT